MLRLYREVAPHASLCLIKLWKTFAFGLCFEPVFGQQIIHQLLFVNDFMVFNVSLHVSQCHRMFRLAGLAIEYFIYFLFIFYLFIYFFI